MKKRQLNLIENYLSANFRQCSDGMRNTIFAQIVPVSTGTGNPTRTTRTSFLRGLFSPPYRPMVEREVSSTHNPFHHTQRKMADNTMDDILVLLCSHVKLERDRGLQTLEERLKDSSSFTSDVKKVEDLQNSLTEFVTSTDRGWETKQGGLLGSKAVILNNLGSEDFSENLRKQALQLMHDDEARVRIASGRTTFRFFTQININIQSILLTSVQGVCAVIWEKHMLCLM